MDRKIARSSSRHPSAIPAARKKVAGISHNLSISKARGKTTATFNTPSGSGYATFGSGKRSMRGAFAYANSTAIDIDYKLEPLRASSRDLFMNSPIGSGILKRAKTMIVNSGLTLQARVDRKYLKLTDEEANDWEDNVEREFKMWSRSKNCDAMRRLDFYAMQGLAILSQLMSGDVFALMPYVARKGWPYRMCVKLVEADFVSNPQGTMDTVTLTSGVETTKSGEVLAYHVSNFHPTDNLAERSWERIPAFGEQSGRQNVLHLFDPERPGQRRGVPHLAPVIEPLKQISRLTEAELMAAVVTSFFTMVIESPAITESVLDTGISDSEKISDPVNVPTDNSTIELGNGSVVGLAPGEKAIPIDPKRPNAAFDPFFQAIVKQIGAAIEMPFEVVMLCFQSSYSASRAAILQAWKWFLARRNAFKREFCCPVYEEWLGEAIKLGRIKAPGFFADPALRAAWSGSEWIGPGMGQINPEAETRAAIARIDGALSTHAKEVASIDGDDWDSMLPTLAREMKQKRASGVMPEVNEPAQKPIESDKNGEPVIPEDETETVPGNKPQPEEVDE